jgi:DNA-binding response OmpR family regulator
MLVEVSLCPGRARYVRIEAVGVEAYVYTIVMTHILIVDDDVTLISAISENLRFRGYSVSTASNGVEALADIEARIPELVLLDIEMPGMDGLHFCCALRSQARLQAIPVIFMSVRSDVQEKLAAYEAGADDYIVKPFHVLELNARLQAVLRRTSHDCVGRNEQSQVCEQASDGETYIASYPQVDPAGYTQVLEMPGLRLYLENALVETSAGAARLTPAEFELLKYFMQHPNQIVSSERILQEVWLYPEGVGESAVVRWHIKNLRRKIEVEPEKPVLLRTLSHHGYILDNQPSSR